MMVSRPEKLTWLPLLALALAAICFCASSSVAQDQTDEANSLKEPSPQKKTLADALAEDKARKAAGTEPERNLVDEYYETHVGPDERAKLAFLDPPNAKRLSKKSRVWVDRESSRVYVDGYVAMREGPLEMFACPAGTKEHESLVATLAKSREVHAALLVVGAKPGSPVRFLPEFTPPTGQKIRVWVCWYEKDKLHAIDGRQWVMKNDTTKKVAMDAEWVFGGSGFWKDPSDGREYYRADGGDMICVSNFSTAMMDVNISSSAEADHLAYVSFIENMPARQTPVRVVLEPIPDEKDGEKKLKPPTQKVVPANPKFDELVMALEKKHKEAMAKEQ